MLVFSSGHILTMFLIFHLKDHEHATFDDILGECFAFFFTYSKRSGENDSWYSVNVEKMRVV